MLCLQWGPYCVCIVPACKDFYEWDATHFFSLHHFQAVTLTIDDFNVKKNKKNPLFVDKKTQENFNSSMYFMNDIINSRN